MPKIHRIMIVDDSAMMRKIVKDIVAADQSVEVVATANNGEDALGQLMKVKPDLILLDIEMPKMDGLQFLRHVRLKSRAKVIILSSVANTGSERASEAIRLGADAIVSKPSGAVSFDLKEKRGSELLQTISSVLG